jgi:hypothetical protein
LPKIYRCRDRTPFFNYEGWRYRRCLSNIITVPTERQRRGDFSDLRDVTGKLIPILDPATTRVNPGGPGFVRDPFAGNVIPPQRLDPVSLNYLQFYPLPNRTPTDPFTNANNWIGQVSERRYMNQTTLRADHRVHRANNLTLRYIYYKHFNDNGYFSPYPDPNARNRLDHYENQNVVLADTHTFSPRLLNEFRVSVARQHFPFRAYSYGKDWPKKLGLPDSVPPYTLPRVSNGLPMFGAFTVGLRGNLTWQFLEMATAVVGNHSVKIGTDVRIQQANNF